jgi:hypothetical protein
VELLYAVSILNTEPFTLMATLDESRGVIEANDIPTSLVDRDTVPTPDADSEVPIRFGIPVFWAESKTVLKE